MKLITNKLENLVEDCTCTATRSYDFCSVFSGGFAMIEDYLIERLPVRLKYGSAIYITSKILLENNQWAYGGHKLEVSN